MDALFRRTKRQEYARFQRRNRQQANHFSRLDRVEEELRCMKERLNNPQTVQGALPPENEMHASYRSIEILSGPASADMFEIATLDSVTLHPHIIAEIYNECVMFFQFKYPKVDSGLAITLGCILNSLF